MSRFLDILKKNKPMNFTVGENLTPEQTQQANQTVRKIDTLEATKQNRFLNILGQGVKSTINPLDEGFAGKKMQKFAEGAGETIARGVYGIAATAGNIPTKLENKLRVSQGLPAKELPIPTEIKVPNSDLTFRDIKGAGEHNLFTDILKSQGVNTEKIPTPAVYAIGSIASTLDLLGFEGESAPAKILKGEVPKKFLRYVTRLKDAGKIEKTLVEVGLDATHAKNLATELAPTKTLLETQDVLLNYGKKNTEEASQNLLTGIKQKETQLANLQFENPQPTKDVVEQISKLKSEIDNLKPQDTSLEQEAKKYKSAEEFVNQGVENVGMSKLFHGGSMEIHKFDKARYSQNTKNTSTFGEGVYLTPSEELAKNYTKGNGAVTTVFTKFKKPFIVDNEVSVEKLKQLAEIKEPTPYLTKPTTNTTEATFLIDKNPTAFKKNLIKEGYDSVIVKYPSGKYEVVSYDPDNNLLTKSQLTDIWNKANQVETTPVIQEATKPIEKTISESDKLIAQGKIRVVSRNGRDTYQYQKGKQWVNARDEDSAVKQVTKEPIKKVAVSKYTPEQEQKLFELNLQKEVIQDRLADHPGAKLSKFISKKEGELLDIKPVSSEEAAQSKQLTNKKERNTKLYQTAENVFEGTKWADSFSNEDSIREAIDEYKKLKENSKNISEQIKKAKEVQKIEPIKVRQMTRSKEIESLEKAAQSAVKSDRLVEVYAKPVKSIDTSTGEGRSLEIAMSKALGTEQPLVGSDVSSLPKIILNTQTDVKNKIHIFDRLRTPDRVLKKIGLEKEAEMLRNAYDEYVKELPKNIDKITAWSKRVPKESNIRIFKWLDGEAIDLNAKEKEVATEIKAWLKEFATRLGLPQDNTIKHYITHIFDEELIKKEFDEDLAKIISDKIPGQVYDPFLEKRLGAQGYKQDTWAALDAYVKRATRKIHMDPALEQIQAKAGSSLEFSNIEKGQWKYVQEYINGINMRPTDLDTMLDNTIKNVIGYKFGQRPVTRLLKILRMVTSRSVIGGSLSSALRNLSQGANTYAVLGEKYTALGYAKLFNKGAKEELEREGVLASSFIEDRVLSSTKKKIQKLDKALYYFFEKAELINRGSTYFGAKAKAINAGKSEEEAIKYAKGIVRKTQFSFDAIDNPVALQGDLMKTLLQYQTFTTKQVEFLGELAKDKNFIGLLRYAVAGTLFVYTIGQAFGMKEKEILPMYRFDTPIALKLPVEVGKAIINTPDKYGNKRDTKQKLQDIGKTLKGLIPAGSQIKRTIEGIKSIKEGGSFTETGKLQYEQGQTLPEKVQSVLFGKFASDEAQNYFKKEETNKKQEKAIKKVYDQIQELKGQQTEETDQQAIDLFESLSEEEKATYKKYKQKVKTQETLQGKKDILPIFQEIRKLKETNPEEAVKLYDSLTEEQKKYYQLVKKQIKEDISASNGDVPDYKDNEAQTDKGVINTVVTYAQAIGVSPATAFNRIFTGQRIRRVDNGAIIVERMPFEKSTKVKKERGAMGDVKLDHTIPLQLGGSNEESNLKLVTNAEWESYTPVENYLGKQLRDKKMSKKEVQELITQFKNGEISAEEIIK